MDEKKISLLTSDDEFDDDSHQELISWAEEALENFLESSYCSSWNKNKKEVASFFIVCFVDYAYGYELAKPFQYNEIVVEEICLNIFPRKLSTKTKDFKLVATTLSAFFEWCEKEGTIKNSKNLIKILKEIDNDIYLAAKNPSNWGLAKSLFFGF